MNTRQDSNKNKTKTKYIYIYIYTDEGFVGSRKFNMAKIKKC